MAAPTTGLTIIKRMTYRGDATEEWSNHYWLSGATPADSAAWRTLFDAFVVEEKKVYTNKSSVIGGYGYDDVSEGAHAIWSVDLRVSPNTPVPGTQAAPPVDMAGDQAAWVRWGLDRLNSNGKRVYLRKYFHSGCIDAPGPDVLTTTYKNALAAFGTKLLDGSFASGRKIVSTSGEVPIGSGTSVYVTTRTLKRRGKRPPTSSP